MILGIIRILIYKINWNKKAIEIAFEKIREALSRNWSMDKLSGIFDIEIPYREVRPIHFLILV